MSAVERLHIGTSGWLYAQWRGDLFAARPPGGVEVYCYFANDECAHAVHNAWTLGALLGQADTVGV